MNQNQQIDVATLLRSIAGQLEQDEYQINQIGANTARGDHGSNMAQAFSTAASAAETSGTDDAGEQLSVAAQAMRQANLGKTTGYYASGLEEASTQLQGKNGLTANDIGVLLQSLSTGIEKADPSQDGRGGMLDAIAPAASAYTSASQQAGGGTQDMLGALLGAAQGAMGTMGDNGTVDPGAASATSMLGGILKASLPILGSMAVSSMSRGGSGQNSGDDLMGVLGGLLGGQSAGDNQAASGVDMGDMLGGLLGGMTGGGGGSTQPQASSDPLGGLGGILGSIMGGSGGSSGSSHSKD